MDDAQIERQAIEPHQGPWHSRGKYVIAENGIFIAKCLARTSRESDAQVLSASRELLDALRFVMTCKPEELQEAFIKAKAAIDKATKPAV